MMEFPRALELMGIEKECVQRNSLNFCDRKCERCDLVQEDTDLIEAFQMAEFALQKLISGDSEIPKHLRCRCGGKLSERRYDQVKGKYYRHCGSCNFEFYEEDGNG